MGNTATYAFPYPDKTSPKTAPADIKALADSVDAKVLNGAVMLGNQMTSDPAAPVTATWKVLGSGAHVLTRMTVAQRPASPAKGELHYNETTNNAELWDGGAYQPLGRTIGTDSAIYEALRDLGATNIPLAWTLDPSQIDTNAVVTLTAQRLAMACITVPRTCVCTGGWNWIDTGQGQIAYAGMGLWQYNADGSATLLRNTTSQGAFFNAPGYHFSAWNGTASGTITLLPGLVYLIGCHSNFSGTAPLARGRPGMTANVGMGSGLHFRSGGVVTTTQTEAAIFKNYTQAQLTSFTNLPVMGVY
jgi:hypothetical protein